MDDAIDPARLAALPPVYTSQRAMQKARLHCPIYQHYPVGFKHPKACIGVGFEEIYRLKYGQSGWSDKGGGGCLG